MEGSIFLAQIFGLYFIIVASGGLFNPKAYQKVLEDFAKSPALLYFSGIFALIFGILVISFHNIWTAHWTVIITIIGWAGLVKGIWLIVFPESAVKFTQLYHKKPNLLTVHLIIALALGIFLAVKGYGLVFCSLAR